MEVSSYFVIFIVLITLRFRTLHLFNNNDNNNLIKIMKKNKGSYRNYVVIKIKF